MLSRVTMTVQVKSQVITASQVQVVVPIQFSVPLRCELGTYIRFAGQTAKNNVLIVMNAFLPVATINVCARRKLVLTTGIILIL